VLLTPTPAHAQAKGATCPVNGYTAAATQATGGQNLVCSSLAWAYVPYQFGASAGTCPGASNVNLGIIQWTGSAFQGCTASGWGSLASGGAAALSALTAATTTNSINNVNFAQTWTWGTLGSNTALTLSSTGMTTGTLLNLSNTDTASNAGTVLIVSNSEGGNSTGISSSMLSATNTGYAGYFSNATTNAGYAIYGIAQGAANTGYAGYFSNTGTGAINYGLYASTSSATGYAGYFNGSAKINGSGAGNINLFINGRIQVGDGSYSGGMWVDSANSMFMGAYSSNIMGFYNTGWTGLVQTSTGSIGIGTTAPAVPLDIRGNVGSQIVNVTDTNAAGYSEIDFFNSTNTDEGSIGWGNASSLVPNEFYVGTLTNSPMYFFTNTTQRMTITG
jgi:hypothetical protein